MQSGASWRPTASARRPRIAQVDERRPLQSYAAWPGGDGWVWFSWEARASPREPRMGKKRKLRDRMHERGLDDATALVICVGKSCCARSVSRALADDARAYAAAHHPEVRIETVGCLHVCEHGPVAATYPEIEIEKRVDAAGARTLIDKLARR